MIDNRAQTLKSIDNQTNTTGKRMEHGENEGPWPNEIKCPLFIVFKISVLKQIRNKDLWEPNEHQRQTKSEGPWPNMGKSCNKGGTVHHPSRHPEDDLSLFPRD